MASFTNLLTNPGRLFIDKTKYIEVLDKVGDYSYMFLRPRRFGKSTFLDTLCKYYDIAERDLFQSLFGGLYIGKNPTKYRNAYLVLVLDLSTIDISGDIDSAKLNFHQTINANLKAFLSKYQPFLGDGWTLDTVLEDNASVSLHNVFVSEYSS